MDLINNKLQDEARMYRVTDVHAQCPTRLMWSLPMNKTQNPDKVSIVSIIQLDTRMGDIPPNYRRGKIIIQSLH